MFRWNIIKRFEKEDGTVSATITIVESDNGCGRKVLRDAQGYPTDNIIIKDDTWLSLNNKLYKIIVGLKNRIDMIRDNKADALKTQKFKY